MIARKVHLLHKTLYLLTKVLIGKLEPHNHEALLWFTMMQCKLPPRNELHWKEFKR
jgi:hypothetical protein